MKTIPEAAVCIAFGYLHIPIASPLGTAWPSAVLPTSSTTLQLAAALEGLLHPERAAAGLL